MLVFEVKHQNDEILIGRRIADSSDIGEDAILSPKGKNRPVLAKPLAILCDLFKFNRDSASESESKNNIEARVHCGCICKKKKNSKISNSKAKNHSSTNEGKTLCSDMFVEDKNLNEEEKHEKESNKFSKSQPNTLLKPIMENYIEQSRLLVERITERITERIRKFNNIASIASGFGSETDELISQFRSTLSLCPKSSSQIKSENSEESIAVTSSDILKLSKNLIEHISEEIKNYTSHELEIPIESDDSTEIYRDTLPSDPISVLGSLTIDESIHETNKDTSITTMKSKKISTRRKFLSEQKNILKIPFTRPISTKSVTVKITDSFSSMDINLNQ